MRIGDDGSSSFGNQGLGQSPDTTGNMNDHERAKGRLFLPFAVGGRRRGYIHVCVLIQT
jgi:hypothetical protein